MGHNADFTSVLRDVVQFLERLRDAKLPASLESVRDSLLIRSKDALTMLAAERIGRATSPEPYLNMNAVGSKGLMSTLRKEAELQEYVGAEERPPLQKQPTQDYYETFQTVESMSNAALAIQETVDQPRGKGETAESTLVDIYASFSAAQTRSKCQMCGSLYRKEGKKLFVFEQYRACWVGLVGLHLLIYGSDRDGRPCTILPIRGYSARPAPNAIPRDHRRSESTFEIFRPGSRTFQFVARTPLDMEEWVAKICELGGEEKDEQKDVSKALVNICGSNEASKSNDQENGDRTEEQYQDVGSLLVADKNSDEHIAVPIEVNGNTGIEMDDSFSNDACLDSTNSTFVSSSPSVASPESVASFPSPLSPPSPPPFPGSASIKIPRKLPSLPVSPSSYEIPEEEEDDIYHKIEDFRDTARYGNIGETFQTQSDNNRTCKEAFAYGNVCVNVKTENRMEEKRNGKNIEVVGIKSCNLRNEDTYDDTVVAVAQDKIVVHEDKRASYDDVESVASKPKSSKDRAADKADETAKSPQKKSFLNRVRSRKDSPRKTEKKAKRKTPPASLPTASNQEPATYYDDVSDLMNVQQETNRFADDQPEYTCPPPPRPIYVKPPTIVDPVDPRELYDDVSAYRDKFRNDDEISRSDQVANPDTLQTNLQQSVENSTRTDADRTVFRERANHAQNSPPDDTEHYKMPRVESRYSRSQCNDQGVEELYDDIAILADFTARQKDVLARKDSEVATKSQGSPEKKSWNRFVGGRRLKMSDTAAGEANGRASNGTDDSDDLSEQHSLMRMNTFQKLISRMESSLGKASSRSTSSIMLNKNNAANNV